MWQFVPFLLVSVAGTPLAAQSATDRPVLDSAEILTRARDAQANFERVRRRLLPIGYGGGGRCEVRVGRLCYWYDDRDTLLPEEPEQIVEVRAGFLEDLAGFHRALPDDGWLLGQRVRYLVEHGDSEAAARLTGQCVTSDWWCLALNGFALHNAEQFEASEKAFDRALAGMPDELRCEWTDWRDVLEGDLAKRLDSLPCAGRRAVTDSLFWLADPLLSLPGNDLRTELLSRRVVAWYLRGSRSTHPMGYGKDVGEILLRYGWSVRWSVEGRRWPGNEARSVIGHSRVPGFSFWPRPPKDAGEAWRYQLDRDRPRSRYAPSYTKRIEPLQRFQLARFPRGDSTAVVVAGEPDDTALKQRAAMLTAVVSQRPNERTRIATRPAADVVGGLTIQLGSTPALVALEAQDPRSRGFARVRWLVEPLESVDGAVLSDPLLFSVSSALPTTLAEAADRALRSTLVPRTDPVGVYWEFAGPAVDSLEVAVALVPGRRGLLGRIGRSLSLVKRRAPLTLQWVSMASTHQVLGRAFELDLSALSPGSYRLVLSVTLPDGTERTTQRSLELLK